MKKILLVGAPGSGKSVLSNELFVELKKKNYEIRITQEYARNFIEHFGVPKTVYLQYHIHNKQTQLENNHFNLEGLDYIIVDPGRISSYFYSCLYCQHNDPRQRIVMQDMYNFLLDDICLMRYAAVFYLPIKKQ
jgi:tRNA uridine 5-carbamoylmethylation protein Kti12